MQTPGRRLTTTTLLVLAAACGETVAPDTREATGAGTAEEPPVPLAWHAPGRRPQLVEAVKTWNDHIETFGRLSQVPPALEARAAAMANVTVHDVLNAVQRRFEPYAYDARADRPLSVEAAIASGAHTVLAAIAPLTDPAAGAYIDSAYADYIATLGECDEVTRGIALGVAAGQAMLARRAGDGSAGPPIALFTSTGEPGAFRSTIGSATALTGPRALATWNLVRPFVINSASQFRPGPPYGAATVEEAVQTAAYLRDYAEVKRLGGAVSERTEQQTEIAYYWLEGMVHAWNRIARIAADERHLNAWRLARLMAQVSLAQADAFIVIFDSKNTFNLWRPVTAIRLGNLDPATPGDPTWQVVTGLGDTPPIPDYTDSYALMGAAVGAVIQATIPGRVAFARESPRLPGKPRHFRSIQQAVDENAQSRLYSGFHFRQSSVAGLAQGKALGAYIAANALPRAGHK